MTLERLLERCKAGVYLEVNGHKNVYQPVDQAVDDLIAADNDIDEELRSRMIAENSVYDLQFYPRTPVGFYRVFGTSLTEVLNKAQAAMDNEPCERL